VLGPGAQAPKLWLDPQFSRTLDTVWSIDFQKKIVNLMPPDRACVHQAAKLVAALLRVARVTAGLAESNGRLPPGS